MEWIFVDDKMPNEGEYVLVTSGEDSPIGISRFIDGEWDVGYGRKRPVFTKTERYLTSASVVYWMNFPEQPERSKREDLHITGDPHLKIEDVENMTKEQMKEKMKEMEDTILRQYIQMTSCYVCPKCVGCGALNSMET